MRVAWITHDLTLIDGLMHPGGCAYYRCMLPKSAAGLPGDFGKPAWTGMHGYGVRLDRGHARFGFDVVVLKQMMQRWVPKEIEAAKRVGQRIIVDVDDHYDGLHEDNLAFVNTDPSVNKISNRNYQQEVIELADTVTVSTPFLLEYYKDKGIRDVRLIRNGVNPKQFEKRKHSTSKPVVGWVGAMKWRSGDVETLDPWFGEWMEEHDVMFHHAGHMADAKLFWDAANINPERVMLSPMRVISDYQNMFAMDIGIVPLNDIDFNHAKSTIKGLEYAASNIPFVAQATPEYARLAELGVGRVASTPEEWVQHLTELLDYNTRKREAAVQRATVLKDYTALNQADDWRNVLMDGNNVCPVKTITVPYGTQ